MRSGSPASRTLSITLLLVATGCGGGSGGGSSGGSGTVPPPELALELVATDLVFPTFLTAPPNDGERLFVVERRGAVRVIRAGALLPTPYLDLSAEVSRSGEQGMLSLAFGHDYAQEKRFYVAYTDLAGDVRVARGVESDADPDRALPTVETVLTIEKQQDFHNGGQIAFGPDGFLYVSIGDDGDPEVAPQSAGDLYGSLLRIDVSPDIGYAIPADNPFVGVPGARGEVWNLGLRNPWRFGFDRANGDLWIADVGENGFEEIDVARAAQGGGAGANYGWSVMEGPVCYSPPSGCDTSGLALPVFSYAHVKNACAVTGGYVYRGDAIPELRGAYFFADLCASWIKSFRLVNGVAGAVTTWPALVTGGEITSFGEDAAGELYVMANWGGVYRIVAR